MTSFTTEERAPGHQSRYVQSTPSNVFKKSGDDFTVTTTVERTNCPESQQNQRFYQSNANNNYNTISSGWNDNYDTQPLKHVGRIEPVTDVNLQFSRPANNAIQTDTEFFHEVKITHDPLPANRSTQHYATNTNNSNINYNSNRNDQRGATYNDYIAYKYNKCLEGQKNLARNDNFASNDYSVSNGLTRSRSIPVTYLPNDRAQADNSNWNDRDQMARNNYKNHYLKQEILTETTRDRGLNRSTHGLSNQSDYDDCQELYAPKFFNNCSDFLQANPSHVSAQGSASANNQGGGGFITKTKHILETKVVTTKKKSNWFNTHMWAF